MPEIVAHPKNAARAVRYRNAALLLQKWAQEDPAYDQRTWDALEPEITKEGVRCEDRDETRP